MIENKYPRRWIIAGGAYYEVGDRDERAMLIRSNGAGELSVMDEADLDGNTLWPETFDHINDVRQLSPPDDLAAAAEIEATWRLIESEFDIEPRAQIEAEAKTNGFKYGLAQAIHTIWKRDPKVVDLAAAAEEAVKEFRNLASLARANCNFFIAARMETAADRLAAAIEKRGK